MIGVNVVVAQLFYKVTACCGTRRFTFVFTTKSVVSQVNPVYTLLSYFFKIRFNITIPCTLKSLQMICFL